ncbi:hypothetical protein [Egbenema bharatensis]|uniref:hypothetical protein n=1 Tax=Egbenema bharatensis TaxID=3463334 RepID=UPI003A85E38D
MLTKGLDQETEKFLSDILAREKTTTDELIKNLIRDRWMALNQSADMSEEQIRASREAMPAAMSQTSADVTSGLPTSAAKQKNNKKAIAEFIKKKRFC